jgi:metal-responsive CopG/Arc/MetJ family transcriptional regulator
MASMHKTTIYLDEELYARVRALADASGKTHATIIREALRAYVSGEGRARPRSVGIGSSGTGDLSERAEEYLSGFGEGK